MKSDKPKVAHEILGVPMVRWVVDAAREAGLRARRRRHRTPCRAGRGAARRRRDACARTEQLGTGHAVMCAREALARLPRLARRALGRHAAPAARDDRAGSSRCASRPARRCTRADDDACRPDRLRPHRARRARRRRRPDRRGEGLHRRRSARIAEINTGTYCFDAAVLFAHLDRLTTENAQGEYYLTDMVAVLPRRGADGRRRRSTDDPLETLGVNSRVQLAEATKVMQRRINQRAHARRRHDDRPRSRLDRPRRHARPRRRASADDVPARRDERRRPGASSGPNSRLTDATRRRGRARRLLGRRSARSWDRGCSVGPVAYLRAGTVLEADAKAGTCVEIKNSTVGEGSKVPHLSYIGDATIGKDVNVGAGSITCNYDGVSQASDRRSATARSSALIPCWLRRSRSARARSPAAGSAIARRRARRRARARALRAGQRRRVGGAAGASAKDDRRASKGADSNDGRERQAHDGLRRHAATPSSPRASPGTSGIELGNVKIRKFANGEIYVRYLESVRGADVFIVQSICAPVNASLMELLIMVDAAKRASARIDHGGHHALRLRAAGQEVRGPRADHRQARRRPADHRRRRPRHHDGPAPGPDPGLLQPAGEPPHRAADPRRLLRVA